jgi:uncharacterized protein (TIGR02246 family)
MANPISERPLRALIDDLPNAIRAKDVNAVMTYYAPDVLTFDLLPPLQYRGAEAIRNRLSEWFSSFEGPIGFEMRGLEITEGGDVAFCHSLNGVIGTNTGGKRVEMWWRATTCFRKIDGQWLVTHGHSSEPFDMRSGKALLDLKP